MMSAAWLAVTKAGGVVVATMPMLRANELQTIVERAQIDLALCDAQLVAEHDAVRTDGRARAIVTWDGELERSCAKTGIIHVPRHGAGRPLPARVHVGHDRQAEGDDSFPSRRAGDGRYVGAQPPRPRPTTSSPAPRRSPSRSDSVRSWCSRCASARARRSCAAANRTSSWKAFPFRRHRMFTAPTAYRAMLAQIVPRACRPQLGLGRRALPKATSDAWHATTGQRIIDGIGATEMIHIFVSAKGDDIRPGATGLPVPGYRVCILDKDYRRCPRHARPLGGARPDRLPLSRGPAPDHVRGQRLEHHRRHIHDG